jgi:hypothetical protein
MKRMMYMLLGGFIALALVFGAAATFAAQSDDGEEATTPEAESGDSEAGDTEAEDESSDESGTTAVPGFGHHGFGGINDEEALAEALGITVEELEAAYGEARTAAIEQAVTDGLITQEQADELLAQGDGFGRGHHGFLGGDKDEYLAEALGISVEELQAAKREVLAAQLAAMVEAGMMTQEQADLIAAREAVQNYVDEEALQAAVQSEYESAVEAAVDAGAITQAQADQLLEALESSTIPGFGFGGFGGRGGHHHGGGFRGGPGFGFPSLPDSETVPAEPTIDA